MIRDNKEKKKRKLNSKGFSLVEILAVITIIGILSTLSVVAVQGILKTSREKYYDGQEKDIEMAARSYFESNKNLLPKVSGQKQVVYLKTLQDGKFISKVKDAYKNDCDYKIVSENKKNSYVQVFKYENNLIYTTHLVCSKANYETNLSQKQSQLKISIGFSAKGNLQSANSTITIEDTLREGVISDKGVVAYQYKIYAGGKLVYTSEMYNVKKKAKVEKKISLKEFVPAAIKIEVSATNVSGNELVKSASTNNFTDKDSDGNNTLTCGTISGASTNWTTSNRTITVQCIDNEGSGCARAVYTKQVRSSTKTTNIQIKDKAGNTRNCTVNAYVDKTAPTTPNVATYVWKNNSTRPSSSSGLSTYSSGSWSNRKVFVQASGSTDAHSGGVYYEYKITGAEGSKQQTGSTYNFEKEGTSTIQFRACDKLKNCTSWTSAKTIKVDYTSPSCGSYNNSTTWVNYNKTINLKCSDSLSGCTKSTFSKSYSSTIKTDSIVIKDNAGNTRTCPVNVYLDKTAPSCGSNNGTTSWTASNRTVTVNCSDSHSGCTSSSFSTNFTSTTRQSNIVIRDKAGNARNCTVNAYVDKTAPSCGNISGASTSWTSGNRTISVGCSDSNSGCSSSSFSQTYSWTQQTSSITIRDKVGNTRSCGVNVYVDKNDPTTPTWGSIGGISGSNPSAWVGEAGGSSDTGAGISHYLYCIRQNNSSWPGKWDGCFTSNRNYTRACGRTTYAYAIAVDRAGNRSGVRGLGSTSDGPDYYYGWGGCSASCGGGTQWRGNACALVTWGLSQSCNTHSCLPPMPSNSCKIRGSRIVNTGRWPNKSCSHSGHTTGYIHYCTDSGGNLYVKDSKARGLSNLNPGINSSLVRYQWVCPTRPYGTKQGWTIIND